MNGRTAQVTASALGSQLQAVVFRRQYGDRYQPLARVVAQLAWLGDFLRLFNWLKFGQFSFDL